MTQGLNNVYIDGIDNQLEPFAHSTDDADPIDELETLMKMIVRDSAFRTEAASFLEKAVSKMPPELRDLYDTDQEDIENINQRLFSEGIANVIATLKGSQIETEVT